MHLLVLYIYIYIYIYIYTLLKLYIKQTGQTLICCCIAFLNVSNDHHQLQRIVENDVQVSDILFALSIVKWRYTESFGSPVLWCPWFFSTLLVSAESNIIKSGNQGAYSTFPLRPIRLQKKKNDVKISHVIVAQYPVNVHTSSKNKLLM